MRRQPISSPWAPAYAGATVRYSDTAAHAFMPQHPVSPPSSCSRFERFDTNSRLEAFDFRVTPAYAGIHGDSNQILHPSAFPSFFSSNEIAAIGALMAPGFS